MPRCNSTPVPSSSVGAVTEGQECFAESNFFPRHLCAAEGRPAFGRRASVREHHAMGVFPDDDRAKLHRREDDR